MQMVVVAAMGRRLQAEGCMERAVGKMMKAEGCWQKAVRAIRRMSVGREAADRVVSAGCNQKYRQKNSGRRIQAEG